MWVICWWNGFVTISSTRLTNRDCLQVCDVRNKTVTPPKIVVSVNLCQCQYLDQVSIVQNSLHYAYHPTTQPTQITLILSKAFCLFLLLVKNAVCYLVERGDMEEVESGVLSSTESPNISFYALQTYSHKKCPYLTI